MQPTKLGERCQQTLLLSAGGTSSADDVASRISPGVLTTALTQVQLQVFVVVQTCRERKISHFRAC